MITSYFCKMQTSLDICSGNKIFKKKKKKKAKKQKTKVIWRDLDARERMLANSFNTNNHEGKEELMQFSERKGLWAWIIIKFKFSEELYNKDLIERIPPKNLQKIVLYIYTHHQNYTSRREAHLIILIMGLFISFLWS